MAASSALAQVDACEQKLAEALVARPSGAGSGSQEAKVLLANLEALVKAALVAAEEEDVPHIAREMKAKAEAKRRQVCALWCRFVFCGIFNMLSEFVPFFLRATTLFE